MSNTVFAFLSFEGPDKYSRAGGLASRVTGLTRELAWRGHETHLFFIGDPTLPGHETLHDGRLHLRRWCQWISGHHPGGAYDGEEAKLRDWNRSLPAYIADEFLPPIIASGRKAVIIGEEWQTADALIALHRSIVEKGWGDSVKFVWNANNTYGFEHVRWPELTDAAEITTVSRYMKYVMQDLGIEARALPNGIESSWLDPLDATLVQPLAQALRHRIAVTKVARWDVEKRWDYAVEAIALMKELALAPVFLARGGAPEKSGAVISHMKSLGLTVSHAQWTGSDARSLNAALIPALDADVVLMESHLHEQQSKLLYQVSDAVIANSAVEPFGLVGLETMAAGGIAAVGATGEDYMTNGYDAISLQTEEPWEFVRYVARMRNSQGAQKAMRIAARKSAARFTWSAVVERSLLPFFAELGMDVDDGAGPGFDAVTNSGVVLMGPGYRRKWIGMAQKPNSSARPAAVEPAHRPT